MSGFCVELSFPEKKKKKTKKKEDVKRKKETENKKNKKIKAEAWFQQQEEFNSTIEEMTLQQLNKCLQKFYLSARSIIFPCIQPLRHPYSEGKEP
ncbi:uncharacterized protein LOC141874732 isoform X2 [Acropora palmata]|uniref:uncharacterized protein LOC141874732 isoform X2 n=1 Tax=Acropora palmata TaxID=6131 RepID=UPI003DA0164E